MATSEPVSLGSTGQRASDPIALRTRTPFSRRRNMIADETPSVVTARTHGPAHRIEVCGTYSDGEIPGFCDRAAVMISSGVGQLF